MTYVFMPSLLASISNYTLKEREGQCLIRILTFGKEIREST